MNEIIFRIFQLLYFLLPAIVANMLPPFTRFVRWNIPISPRLLGKNKTMLGFVVGVAGAVITAFVLSRVQWQGSIADFGDWFVLGLLFGFGAMLGDCVKSFFKRKKGILPGKPWMVFDQLDFVIGALVLVWHRVVLSLTDVLIIFLITFLGSILINHLAFWLGIKRTRW